jgi:hypothetical protein
MGRAPARWLEGDRVALAFDWQWGNRYLRAGLKGSVVGHDPFGQPLVTLDCFTPDSTPQVVAADLLAASPSERPEPDAG